uniref:DNA pilot protein n=1 Tax=Dulem virus 149 TaxID=3145626 RepID=A0AAU8AYR8_9VIRU
MDWGSAIGGIASAAGSIGDLFTGGYFSRKAWQRQKEAMKYAHQWEVADLRKAGLNPVLSGMGGSGASTGGLTSPMVESNFSGAAKDAFQNALSVATAKNVQADTELKESQKYAQDAQKRMYDYQAAINAENAYSLYRENRFWDKNLVSYSLGKYNQAVPGLGLAAGAIGMGLNSAKGVEDRYRGRDELIETHPWIVYHGYIDGVGKNSNNGRK